MKPEPSESFATTYCSIDHARAIPTASGYCLPLIDAATRTLARLESHVTRLHPKCISHEPHRHPDEELVIVKSGLLEVQVEGQTHLLSEGDLIVIAARDFHGIRNTSNEVVEYYVIRMDITGAGIRV